MQSPTKKNASLANQSSEKLLSLIEVLSVQDNPIRLSDLAALLDMNASTVSRFLTTLQNRGYVMMDSDSGKYSMTYKICQLANNLTSRMDLRSICRPYLHKISKIFNCTSNLITRYEYSVIYLEVVAGPQQLLVPLQRIGKVAPLYCTGAGKIFLQEFSNEEMDDYASAVSFDRFTEHTICSVGELKKVVAQSAALGYAVDNEECEIGTRCLAVPIYDYTGHIHAAISINAPSAKLTDEYILQNVDTLKGIAGEVSRLIGYS
jgi:DNA-binding IclR family transcriptional regulator